jgi:hypothetical protein
MRASDTLSFWPLVHDKTKLHDTSEAEDRRPMLQEERLNQGYSLGGKGALGGERMMPITIMVRMIWMCCIIFRGRPACPRPFPMS